MAGLTAKQQRFVEEYLIDLNATQAAIRAGYSWGVVRGYYVYFLIDPRDGNIFYVGKGSGRRAESHAKNVVAGRVDNAPKFKRIRDIHISGHEVVELIVDSGMSEDAAYRTERMFIKSLREYGLTNIVNGCVTNNEAATLMAEELLKRLKSFDEWSIDIEAVETVRRVFGNPKEFYGRFKLALENATCAT